jgi:hypothetical protein
VRNAWEDCQAKRDRDAIYSYLTAVFNLVAWWAAENCALERARKALRLRCLEPSDHDEPFAAVIRCTSDLAKVDKRTRSKWSRVLRYALKCKSHSEPLERFIKRKGGINECAARFARCLGGMVENPGGPAAGRDEAVPGGGPGVGGDLRARVLGRVQNSREPDSRPRVR